MIPVSSIEEDLRKLVKRIEDMDRRESFNLISMTDGGDFSSRREESTGRWLLEAPKSKSWPKEGRQTPSPHGMPEARKNIIQRNSAVDAGHDIDSMWQKFLLSTSKT